MERHGNGCTKNEGMGIAPLISNKVTMNSAEVERLVYSPTFSLIHEWNLISKVRFPREKHFSASRDKWSPSCFGVGDRSRARILTPEKNAKKMSGEISAGGHGQKHECFHALSHSKRIEVLSFPYNAPMPRNKQNDDDGQKREGQKVTKHNIAWKIIKVALTSTVEKDAFPCMNNLT